MGFERIKLGFVSVYLIKGKSGNVLIDAGAPGMGASILKRMARCGVAPGSLSLIVITHAHTDHFGGLCVVTEASGAPVAIHQKDAGWLERGVNAPAKGQNALGRMATRREGPEESDLGIAPDIIWEDEMDLSPYCASGKLVHTPGHTAGSSSVVLGGDIAIGDMLMGWVPPRKPKTPFLADDMDALADSVEKLLALNPRFLWAGHGGPFAPESAAAWLARYKAERKANKD